MLQHLTLMLQHLRLFSSAFSLAVFFVVFLSPGAAVPEQVAAEGETDAFLL